MSEPDDIDLMAYADGELSPEGAAIMEAYLARSPAAAEKVARMRAARARLKSAYEAISDEEAPTRLTALLKPPAPAVDLSARRTALSARRWRPRDFGAIAASLAAGFVIAAALFAGRERGLVAERDGALLASTALDDALTRQAAADAGPVAIGVTFKDAAGAWCRTFSSGKLAGLACRENGAWSIKTLISPDDAGAGAGYRMAASATAPEIIAAVEARIEGEPLDAEEEAEALRAGWPK